MIVTLMDGDTLRTMISNCTGYVAKRIEIEAKDVSHLRMLLERDPASLKALLAQLEHRFPERRAPFAPYPHQEEALRAFQTGMRKYGKAPELGMGYSMGKARTMEQIAREMEAAGYKVLRVGPRRNWDQADIYKTAAEFCFPDRPVMPTKPLRFGPCKPDHTLRNWFWFWFTFIFIFFG